MFRLQTLLYSFFKNFTAFCGQPLKLADCFPALCSMRRALQNVLVGGWFFTLSKVPNSFLWSTKSFRCSHGLQTRIKRHTFMNSSKYPACKTKHFRHSDASRKESNLHFLLQRQVRPVFPPKTHKTNAANDAHPRMQYHLHPVLACCHQRPLWNLTCA